MPLVLQYVPKLPIFRSTILFSPTKVLKLSVLAKTEAKIKLEPLWMVEGVDEVACCFVPNAI